MCTCIMVKNKNTYFGRNMDLHYSFDESVIIVPRNFKLSFKLLDCITNHYAIIGIGTVIDNYPLFAEASNEKGLSIAALNFMGNAFYFQINNKKINLAPYELFTYLLAKFKTINEVKKFLITCRLSEEEKVLFARKFRSNLEVIKCLLYYHFGCTEIYKSDYNFGNEYMRLVLKYGQDNNKGS